MNEETNPDQARQAPGAAGPAMDGSSPDSGAPAEPLPDPHPITDSDLNFLLNRAMRTVAWVGLALSAILTLAAGWQTGLLMLAGAAISWTGILEWRNLSNLVFDLMDKSRPARSVGRTASLFFLRLGIAAVILYISLKYLHGNVYALVGGLGLAVVALTIEALRFLRG